MQKRKYYVDQATGHQGTNQFRGSCRQPAGQGRVPPLAALSDLLPRLTRLDPDQRGATVRTKERIPAQTRKRPRQHNDKPPRGLSVATAQKPPLQGGQIGHAQMH